MPFFSIKVLPKVAMEKVTKRAIEHDQTDRWTHGEATFALHRLLSEPKMLYFFSLKASLN